MKKRDITIPSTIYELPSEQARLCLSIKKFIEENLCEPLDDPIIVACSGGLDSIALAVILRCLGLKIYFAHMNHQLRKESNSDASYVNFFAEQLKIPCIVSSVDIAKCAAKRKTGIEETAREERYCFFEKVRKDYCASWIATGHHLSDLSEDVLLRLIRGTGWPGLGGMKAIDRERHLLRPLLNTPRVALKNLLTQLSISWVEDASNNDMVFKRNRIRHKLLPLVETENPNFLETIRMLWLIAREDEYFWNEMLANIFSKIQHSEKGFWIPRELLVTLPKAARLRVYMEAIRRLKIGQGRSNTFFLLDTALTEGKRGKYFQFPGNIVATLDKSSVSFKLAPPEDS